MAFLDACWFTAGSSGTADFTDGSARPGYRNLSSAGAANAAVYSYRAESADKSQWEMGIGAYNSSTGVLARTTIYASSTGAKVNFGTAPMVALMPLKAQFDVLEAGAALGATAVQPSRTISAGTGLSGGGDLSGNRSLSVSYGTTAGTAAQGNDSRIPPAGSTNDRILAWIAGAHAWSQLTIGMVPDSLLTYAKLASGALASFGEFNSAAASKLLTNASVWANLAVLTDGTNISVDFNDGYDFGGASNEPLAIAGNRTVSAPTNARNGKKGILWFTATGATRTLTLNAAFNLLTGVEAGPYSITTSQILGVAYAIRGTTTYVTAILRIG